LPGAYYAKLIDQIEARGGLGSSRTIPQKQVHTAWDLGRNDATAIWFVQANGAGWDVIDYYANTSVGIDHYVIGLASLGYNYGEHLLPHDAANEQLVSRRVRSATIKSMVPGWKVRIVPRRRNRWRTTSTRSVS
jgi:phage terminase large subunit